jgi:hypothetical protein
MFSLQRYNDISKIDFQRSTGRYILEVRTFHFPFYISVLTQYLSFGVDFGLSGHLKCFFLNSGRITVYKQVEY